MNITNKSAIEAFKRIAEHIEKYGLSHDDDADHGAVVVLPYIWEELELGKLIVPDDCEYIYIGLNAGDYIEVDSYEKGATILHRPAGIHRVVEEVSAAGYIEIELLKPNSHMDDSNAKYMFNGWQVRACISD